MDSTQDDEIRPVTRRDRDPGTWYEIGGIPHLSCSRGAPVREAMAVAVKIADLADSAETEDDAEADRDEAALQLRNVIHAQRDCDLFEPYQEPMALDWHMQNWQRREENRHAESLQWIRLIASAVIVFLLGARPGTCRSNLC